MEPILVILLIVAVVLYLFDRYVPLETNVKRIITAIVAIVAIAWVIYEGITRW